LPTFVPYITISYMYQIRDAVENDIPEIMAVVKSSWFSVYPEFIPLEILEKISAERHNFSGFYEDMFIKSSYNPVVINAEGKMVGMALVINSDEADKNYGFIRRFYLLPEYQRQGIGSLLIKDIVEKNQDKEILLLEVETANKRAANFYKKQGFKVYKKNIQDIEGLAIEYLFMMRALKV